MADKPTRYGGRMELKKYMPAALHSLIHRASVSTYSNYKSNKQTRLKLSVAQEAEIGAFITVADFWRVVGGKVRERDVRGLMKQQGLFQ